jgi:glycosyltransferase involved in cell wall biosynthesis
MKSGIAVVIPCYKVEKHIKDVVVGLPDFIDHIILVDDKSPDSTLQVINEIFAGYQNTPEQKNKISIVKHEENQGVGGAMISGFTRALELGCKIVVKMDGDGQMDPAYISSLIKPLENSRCHVTKGNRFYDLKALMQMPFARRLGNFGLGFLIKAASGYWSVFDPTNGFFAIKADTLRLMDFDRLDKRYFFESSFLIELYYTGAVIKDISIPARYGEESSNLSIYKSLWQFPPKLCKAFIRRILLRYFIYDFTVYTIYLLLGLPLFLFGVIFGIVKWIHYSNLNIMTPTGTVMIAVLSIVIGFQLLLSVIQYDTSAKMPYIGND